MTSFSKLVALLRPKPPPFPPELLRVLVEALELEPRVLPWMYRVPGSRPQWISTWCSRSELARYRGKELLVLDAEHLSYYRLPGAKPAGEGVVKDGRYALELERPGDTPLSVTVERRGTLDMRVVSFGPTAEPPVPTVHHPVRIPYALELEDWLASWCEGLDAVLRLGAGPAPAGAAAFVEGIVSRVGATGDRLPFAVACLERTLNARASEPRARPASTPPP